MNSRTVVSLMEGNPLPKHLPPHLLPQTGRRSPCQPSPGQRSSPPPPPLPPSPPTFSNHLFFLCTCLPSPPSSPPLLPRSSSTDTTLTRAQEEIEQLKQQVSGLSSQLAAREAAQSLLQDLLQETCLCEREHVERRRKEAQEDIGRAQKVVCGLATVTHV